MAFRLECPHPTRQVRATGKVNMLDYPSQHEGMLGPPEPMLLDTCVIQNIEWVWDQMETPEGGQWSDERVAHLERRFGAQHADELLCLGRLVEELQWSGFPWLVSTSARAEVEASERAKKPRIVDGWSRLFDAVEDWHTGSFRGVAYMALHRTEGVRINPLILRGLGVASFDGIVADGGPLSSLRDVGDRALVRDAMLAGVPAILTTDVRSFWNQRSALFDLGVEVWRPSDALTAYESKWLVEQKHLLLGPSRSDAHAGE